MLMQRMGDSLLYGMNLTAYPETAFANGKIRTVPVIILRTRLKYCTVSCLQICIQNTCPVLPYEYFLPHSSRQAKN